MSFNEAYWSNRYKNNQTQWDMGIVSPPIEFYINQLVDKELNILIPGCGNSYEAQYLFEKGFVNTKVVDLAEAPLKNLKKRVHNFPAKNLIHANFFELAASFKYDLIIEQTFFCALAPSLRKKYVSKCAELLKDSGKVVGLLFFDIPANDHPPFGASKAQYLELFRDHFRIDTFEQCKISHPARMGKEYWFEIFKKN